VFLLSRGYREPFTLISFSPFRYQDAAKCNPMILDLREEGEEGRGDDSAGGKADGGGDSGSSGGGALGGSDGGGGGGMLSI